MSVQTLYTAATGMEALETKLDVIANNMANINTTGFKKDRANFEDLFYRQIRVPGSENSDGSITPTGIEVGLGVRVASTQSDHDQGAFETTENALDFAIEGSGFFQVAHPSGQTVYTRAGNFGINANNELVLGSANTGYRIEPSISIPEEATEVVVSADGNVQYRTSDSPDLSSVGTIQIATFINPDGLLKMGDNLFAETAASGTATPGNPGDPGYGSLRQGFLEASNVEPVTELIDLINTQRGFELNSQVVQAGDEIMQVVANIRR
ncbi:flagellar basal-body rod protein FlgG [Aeoliella mucimassa]|uniref:Flagellar basal-body rod protein FlgG n=1 Tax=Aeoliella mucimassa TaxID=2527972 RepID=A0A518ARU3_9BACT|nr:flagellar basal-body rod protein FlgG [Aeoliella mucimassa]QDU57447.1 Flagellar basal-body rod protein FlgG [Aeoliella mucimassa]